jgi:regulator of nonsense transcripts 1
MRHEHASKVDDVLYGLFVLLWLQVEPITLRIPLPKSGFSAPNLPELNHSQLHAVRSVLQQPLSLIQVSRPQGSSCCQGSVI